MLKFFADLLLKLIGWRFDARLPAEKKCIILGAPHTSNWDFPLAMLCFWSTPKHISRNIFWVAKKQLFVGPLGTIFRKLGGIPVDRSASTGFIKQIANQFDLREEMILAIAPEGTRSKVEYWKTGFYYIALTANVPICLGYLDYSRRSAGFGKVLIPSGDIEKDFEDIKLFYRDKIGKIPQNQGEIKIRPYKS